MGDYVETGVASSLKQRDYKDATDLVYGLDRASFNQGKNAKYDFQIEENKASPLVSRGPSAVASADYSHNSVRRLTPLEAERLQGFPDNWTALPGASDSARYKALGNSIARPFWTWLAKRFVDMGGVKTIGSLFDGIGGFPLCFGEAGAETLWTSEIEPFCQKVVETRFGCQQEE